jgi:hypothetical protein
MADVRESILTRLREIAKVRGVSTVARNAMTLSDGSALPAVIVYDGDEEVRADPPGRPSPTPQVVTMFPVLQVTVQGEHEVVGEALNELRLRLISAITTDATLIGLSGDNRHIRYQGCVTKFQAGRATQGDMAVRFSILYYLRPSDF